MIRCGRLRRMLGIVLLLALSGPALHAQATEIVMRPLPDGAKGPEPDLNGAVIDEALKRTVNRYGPYQYAERIPVVARERLLDEMLRGEAINITVVATQPVWEEQLHVIRIPIDMGLSGYRIALIRRDRQSLFNTVRDLDTLKRLRLGAGEAWSSRQIFAAEGFSVETGETYEALLRMLLAGRSDYFPRALTEAFPEYDARRKDFPDLAIERDLLLNLPLPTYIFVSPKAPELARRIEAGLESMVRDGSLLRLVMKFNGDILRRANLCSRRVFKLDNPLLTPQTPLRRKALWFDPFDRRTGLCAAKTPPETNVQHGR
ncbi:MAG: transporter substrate-binding protein [Proteobacteria bacterium]|nr:transporter substrate-binding protein [Pseudomonadota bacterium]